MGEKKLWRCWFRGTGTRFSSHWGVSQHFADAVLRHIFLAAGLEVRCAKCINVTIFLRENKRHIYGSAHDFVWLRVCRSRSSPPNCYIQQHMPEVGRTVWFLWRTSDRKWCKQTRRAQARPSNRRLIARSRFPALPQSCVNCAEMFSKNNDGFAWPAARVTSAPHVFRKLSHCETGGGGVKSGHGCHKSKSLKKHAALQCNIWSAVFTAF